MNIVFALAAGVVLFQLADYWTTKKNYRTRRRCCSSFTPGLFGTILNNTSDDLFYIGW